MGMLGAALVYVGFVLFMNGLKTLGKLKASHVIPMNLYTHRRRSNKNCTVPWRRYHTLFLCNAVSLVRVHLFMDSHQLYMELGR